MRTRKDAERVVHLSDQREALHKLASSIRMAESIAACDPSAVNSRVIVVGRLAPSKLFQFTHLVGELRDLIKREAAEQIAEIDKELEDLGVVPDEFEAADPKKTAEPPWRTAVGPSRG